MAVGNNENKMNDDISIAGYQISYEIQSLMSHKLDKLTSYCSAWIFCKNVTIYRYIQNVSDVCKF